jgi:Flp pilus assembly pilin Flp
MKAMAEIIRFWQCESGAVAVEYSLLIAFITVAIIGAVTIFGTAVRDKLYGEAVSKIPG